MAFWGEKKWIAANASAEIATGFDSKYLEDGNYRLSVGDEVIVSSNFEDREQAYRKLNGDEILSLRPGQFAFLITEERIHVPKCAIGFINVATGTKFKGLINISGFHVDPGYSGKLIFSVFNAGPVPITIHPGQRIFRLWLSDYDSADELSTTKSKTTYDRLPREWADSLYGTFPSPFALSARVTDLEAELGNLRTQRNQFIIAAAIIALFLFPFVASLYASTFAPWFGTAISDRVRDVFVRKSLPLALPNAPPTPVQSPDAAPASTSSKPATPHGGVPPSSR